ncbi:MAG: 50S ribosomal protein L9 [Spirochaetaceae bacterium]|nr:50S ribosomal protein L9 [Spirochaetaceae bacterium]
MKVILNKDISPLGEEGDVRDVAKGYARNFLLPRGIAFRYTEKTARLFESRREEIAERKELKRQDATGVKDRLQALELSITMPAGANGKLYGAVTGQTIMDELAKQGFQIERKRIEIPGNSIKSIGRYKFTIKLYGNTTAELFINIAAQETKPVSREAPARGRRRYMSEGHREKASETKDVSGENVVPAAETAIGEQVAVAPEATE